MKTSKEIMYQRKCTSRRTILYSKGGDCKIKEYELKEKNILERKYDWGRHKGNTLF